MPYSPFSRLGRIDRGVPVVEIASPMLIESAKEGAGHVAKKAIGWIKNWFLGAHRI